MVYIGSYALYGSSHMSILASLSLHDSIPVPVPDPLGSSHGSGWGPLGALELGTGDRGSSLCNPKSCPCIFYARHVEGWPYAILSELISAIACI